MASKIQSRKYHLMDAHEYDQMIQYIPREAIEAGANVGTGDMTILLKREHLEGLLNDGLVIAHVAYVFQQGKNAGTEIDSILYIEMEDEEEAQL